MKSILDPSFRYTASFNTDLKKTFARIRGEPHQATTEPVAEAVAVPGTPRRVPGRPMSMSSSPTAAAGNARVRDATSGEATKTAPLRDSTTRRMLEDILAVEEQHADELADLLVAFPADAEKKATRWK